METKIISGKDFSAKVLANLKIEIDDFKGKYNITPGLAVILVGDDPASHVYVSNKNKKAKELGFNSYEINYSATVSEDVLLAKINELNNDANVHAILVQLPLPTHINKDKVINHINPSKDVDGFNILNVGKLHTKQDALFPCTPYGCLLMLKDYFKEGLQGKHAVIIGRSDIVGKPMAELLLQENATITMVHSKTQNIKDITNKADIIVAAIGKPLFVDSSYVKEGVVVIDVGINRILLDNKYKLVGDVNFADINNKAAAITPVPGGVGPMTIACLMVNCLKAAKMSVNLDN
jgi:methylenetetrahydrofolate dehydrogenase (NADP+)/methenyltetrahydrofolate cyclohydrolase